jgi:hypothetical protein
VWWVWGSFAGYRPSAYASIPCYLFVGVALAVGLLLLIFIEAIRKQLLAKLLSVWILAL